MEWLFPRGHIAIKIGPSNLLWSRRERLPNGSGSYAPHCASYRRVSYYIRIILSMPIWIYQRPSALSGQTICGIRCLPQIRIHTGNAGSLSLEQLGGENQCLYLYSVIVSTYRWWGFTGSPGIFFPYFIGRYFINLPFLESCPRI